MKLGNLNEPYENLLDGTTLWYIDPVSEEDAAILRENGNPLVKAGHGVAWTHAKAIVTMLCAREVAENGTEATEAGLLSQVVYAASRKEEEVDLKAADIVLIRKMGVQFEKFPTMCRGPLESALRIAETMSDSNTNE